MRPSAPRKACLVALTVLGGLLTLGAIPGAASGAIKLGVYSGANGKPTTLESAATLDSYTAMVGRKPDIVMDYGNITEPLLTQTKIDNVESHGVTPMITWQLFQSGWGGPTISLSDVAAGKYDSYLRQSATLAKGLPFPVMIRFAHEMNGDWYGWSGDAANYVNAFRHVVDIFRAAGVTNVSWVWSPNVDHGDYPIAPYFPGDAYVDYVALDGYNWGTTGLGMNKWESFAQVFGPSYQTITQLSSKPVIIAETSSSETGGDKAQWIRDGLLNTVPNCFPRVAAVIWYDRALEDDWRINSSSASLSAYRDVVSSSVYGGPVATTPSGSCTTTTTTQPKPGKPPKKKRVRLRALRVTHQVRTHGQISFRLSQHATVQIAVKRQLDGGRFAPKVALTRNGGSGRNRVNFSRRFRGERLTGGHYRVTLVAVDSDGGRSRPHRSGFKVV